MSYLGGIHECNDGNKDGKLHQHQKILQRNICISITGRTTTMFISSRNIHVVDNITPINNNKLHHHEKILQRSISISYIHTTHSPVMTPYM